MKMLLYLFLTSTLLAQTPGTFTATGSMTTPRAGHTATLLRDGRVLIAGGQQLDGSQVNPLWAPNAPLASAELYDPATGMFTPTGNMTTPRTWHSATLLPDGRVLIVGGLGTTQATAELYDSSTGTFTSTGGTTTVNGIATLLRNGKVLITGNTAQLYDPATATFASTGDYAGEFYYGTLYYPDTATLLPDGRVLIVGNAAGDGYLEREELYDPVTGTFKLTGKMHTFGFGSDIWSAHTATLLPNGKVLLAGGVSEDFGTFSIAELYDPSTDTFIATANMTTPRAGHTATLLPDGTVLLAGGQLVGALASAELYDPATGAFNTTGNMTTPRFFQAATPLSDGTVLITGGVGSSCCYDSAELYVPPVTVLWQQAITAMKTAAGTDSLNFWQWAYYWQNAPPFAGAPNGFGVSGSISPDRMAQITAAGGGNVLLNISAEQWVVYYRSSTTVVSGVVNAASHLAGAIAPGELVVVTGSGLGPAQVVSAVPDSDGLYGAQIAGSAVLVNGMPVPLISASATQVEAVVPDSIAGGIAQVTVTYQGQTSASFPVSVAPAAPGIFTVDSTGQGHAASINQNGLVNTPAHGGDVITLFATGLGQATSAVTIHGFNLPLTPISVGKGTVPGVMQIKVPIPIGQDCDTQVVVQVGDDTSQQGVTIAMDICI